MDRQIHYVYTYLQERPKGCVRRSASVQRREAGEALPPRLSLPTGKHRLHVRVGCEEAHEAVRYTFTQVDQEITIVPQNIHVVSVLKLRR